MFAWRTRPKRLGVGFEILYDNGVVPLPFIAADRVSLFGVGILPQGRFGFVLAVESHEKWRPIQREFPKPNLSNQAVAGFAGDSPKSILYFIGRDGRFTFCAKRLAVQPSLEAPVVRCRQWTIAEEREQSLRCPTLALTHAGEREIIHSFLDAE